MVDDRTVDESLEVVERLEAGLSGLARQGDAQSLIVGENSLTKFSWAGLLLEIGLAKYT
jgi:hypothetical protein